MERAELSHPASARTAGAAPAQGRPSTYRPLTPPPPLSGPERKADPEYVAAGGDTARYASSPRVRILEWPGSPCSPERASLRLPPLRPQLRPPRSLFSLASEPAAAGNARGRHVTTRRVTEAGPRGAEAVPRTRELAPASPFSVRASLRCLPALSCLWGPATSLLGFFWLL